MPKELSLVLLPNPPGFDANSWCDFHAGAPRYSTKVREALKSRVHDLLDTKMFSFTHAGPIINNNLLPGHARPSVNVVEEVIKNRRWVIIILI